MSVALGISNQADRLEEAARAVRNYNITHLKLGSGVWKARFQLPISFIRRPFKKQTVGSC